MNFIIYQMKNILENHISFLLIKKKLKNPDFRNFLEFFPRIHKKIIILDYPFKKAVRIFYLLYFFIILDYFPFNFLKFPQIKTQAANANATNLEKIELYKKTQIFLEIIYKKLYFIVLNYEESVLQFFEFENLNKIRKIKEISFDHSNNSHK